MFARRRKRQQLPPALNLTSMMDMLTIILIFLIFSFSAEDQNLKLDPDLTLPASTSGLPFKWAINVNLTPTELKVEGQTVAKVKKGKLVGSKVDTESKRVFSLYNLLKKVREVEQKEKINPTEDETVISFQADRDTPFELIDLVMKTSAQAGYPNFRLVVMKQ